MTFNTFKSYIFENVNQGIILYDYDETMLLCNNKALRFLSSTGIKKDTNLSDFLQAHGQSLHGSRRGMQTVLDNPYASLCPDMLSV